MSLIMSAIISSNQKEKLERKKKNESKMNLDEESLFFIFICFRTYKSKNQKKNRSDEIDS